ncbi:MAG: hypothetical protein ACMUIG_00205 [Thermoplasmatota archaeon]
MTLADPPTRGSSANCSSCHGSNYYLTVDIISVDCPAALSKGETGDVTVSVEVTADGTNSYWQFDLTVRIRSLSSKVTVPSQQTFSNQRPSGSSEPYTWNKDVVFTISGKSGGSDTVRAEASMDADHQSPPVSHTMDAAVSVQNNAPALDSGSVSPASGTESTPFSYEVSYSDPDDDVPSYVRAYIDGSSYEMTPRDGTPDTLLTGEVYSVEGIVLDPGSHEYYFEASDGEETAQLGATSPFSGPDVSDSNDPPILSNPGVDPAGGSPDTVFSFRITYTDSNGDPPVNGVMLHIDGDETGIAMDRDPEAPSDRRDGDYTNGEDYIHGGTLPEGDHQFSFSGGDGEFEAFSGPHFGPSVSVEPILIARIISPEDGGKYISSEEIPFSGDFSSNEDLADSRFLWYSNISGVIGEQSDFSLILPNGVHDISLTVYSIDFDLSDEVHVTITVADPEPVVPPFEATGYLPSGDHVIHETEVVTFSVSLRVNRGDPRISWFFDGESVGIDTDEWTYESFYDSSGDHRIELVITDEAEDHEVIRIWNLTVIDVPAPITIGGAVPQDLGDFDYGEPIEIEIDLSDPLGRDIVIVWKIDGRVIPQTGRELSITAGSSAETMAGNHLITVMAENPDGETVDLSISFRVLAPMTEDGSGDDDGDDGGRDPPREEGEEGRKLDLGLGPLKKEWPGYLIMIIGTAAVLAGAVYSAAVLMPKRNVRQIERVGTSTDYQETTAVVLEEYER